MAQIITKARPRDHAAGRRTHGTSSGSDAMALNVNPFTLYTVVMAKKVTSIALGAEERTYRLLREEIVNGHLPGGCRLRETALAERLGVSRTPVRAALQRLAAEGLVDFKRHLGAVVRTLPLAEADQIFAVRAVLESFAAGLAAERISAGEIATLTNLCAQMDDYARREPPDLAAIANLNKKFHQVIFAASGNLYAQRLVEHLSDLNFIIRSYQRFSRQQLDRSMAHHRELVEAFRARDAAWAQATMTAHVQAGRSLIQDQLKALSDTAVAGVA